MHDRVDQEQIRADLSALEPFLLSLPDPRPLLENFRWGVVPLEARDTHFSYTHPCKQSEPPRWISSHVCAQTSSAFYCIAHSEQWMISWIPPDAHCLWASGPAGASWLISLELSQGWMPGPLTVNGWASCLQIFPASKMCYSHSHSLKGEGSLRAHNKRADMNQFCGFALFRGKGKALSVL